MAYQITTIAPDGTRTRIETLSPASLSEKAVGLRKRASDKVQALIKEGLAGGWREVIPEFTEYGARQCVVFGDVEAKLKGLPLNPKATYLWYACLAPEPFRPDQLHGPIVIVTADTPQELGEL